ncbi:MAG TPA: hypothetical protein GXX34_06685 [Clostridia bacterium]|nr:hypothetical protein [Clostridia bacterium]
MWKANEPETLQNSPLSVLLHRAWLERKKNFESEIHISSCQPLLTEMALAGTKLQQFTVVTADGKGSAANCTACCQTGNSDTQTVNSAAALRAVGERLNPGQCSGLIAITYENSKCHLSGYSETLNYLNSIHCRVSIITNNLDFVEHVLPLNGGLSNLTIVVSAKLMFNGNGSQANEDLESLMARLKAICQQAKNVSFVFVISGECERELDLLMALSQLDYCHLTLLDNSSGSKPVNGEQLEQCAKLVAIARILNPKRKLIFAGTNNAPSMASLLEQYALNAGVNEIARPSEEAISLLKDLGLDLKVKERCCLVH